MKHGPGRRSVWLALAGLLLLTQGPRVARFLHPPTRAWDFFQEWASARNLLSGLPVYTLHEVTIPLYLGQHEDTHSRDIVEVNAHPPASVLLAIPLARLPYDRAHLFWNLLSLAALGASGWLVVRNLGLSPRPWAALTAAAILTGHPLQVELNQGQLTLLLLLLLTATWTAERSGSSGWAGVLLAAAAAIKLFPVFGFLYFVLRRQWQALAAGAVTLAVITAGSAAVLGSATYESYCREVLPRVGEWRGQWHNHSLPGFWNRLFDPGDKGDPVRPLVRSATLARTGALLSVAAITFLLARVVLRARTRAERDHAFGLTVMAMLLVSPITWEHYFLLLLAPLAVLWVGLPERGWRCWLFWCLVGLLCANPGTFVPGVRGPDGLRAPAGPWCSVTLLSIHLYALLGLFAFALGRARAGEGAGPPGKSVPVVSPAATSG